jgi:hypothetical protein
MIPLCAQEKVSITEDGITWDFKPMDGLLEREFIELFDKGQGLTGLGLKDYLDTFINKILLGWQDVNGKMPKLEAGRSLASYLQTEEQYKLMLLFRKANTLTTEEKKS